MDTNRYKKAAQWFYSNVFQDEAIQPRVTPPDEKLPSLLRTARSLENNITMRWQSRESIFLKQGKLLANYEDDYTFEASVTRYFPTYQALTDRELRGYFSWRTRLRNGEIRQTSLSFAFLYIYELLNQIGVADPLDGYHKLETFRDIYGQIDNSILPYLRRWMTDYAIFYQLDPELLRNSPQVLFDRSICVLDSVREQPQEAVIAALQQSAPKWLARSKFYSANKADCDSVIYRVLCRVSDHYATHTKRTMAEQFFGSLGQFQVHLFESAVFCNPLRHADCDYTLDPRCIYHCRNGQWTVSKHAGPLRPSGKLEDLLKTVDAVMREEYAYKYPVKFEAETKWLLKVIREEVQAFLAEKKAAELKKITIDYSQLARIRREAAVTQEKLTVEEELEYTEEPLIPQEISTPVCTPAQNDMLPPDCPLNAPEYRLLQCLLYGKPWHWVQSEGYMLSILSDSINDKLYDIFMDAVMDDTPSVIPDYIDDLKEMILP